MHRAGIWLALLAGLSFMPVAQARAATLAEMRADNELELCAHPDALPYSSAASGAQPGFQVELTEALAKELGLPLKVTWITSRPNARFTTCDAFAGVAVMDADDGADGPPDKVMPLLHTKPYMALRTVLATQRAPESLTGLDSLRGLRVAVPSGSWAHVLLVKADIPVLVRFLHDDAIIDAIASGQADAGIVSEIGLGWFQKNHPDVPMAGTKTPIAGLDLDFDIAMGLRRANLATRDEVDAALARLRDNGTIAAVLARYGIPYHAPAGT